MKQKIERLRSLMEKATSLPWQSKHDYTIEGEFSIIGNVDGEIHHDGCEYTYTAIADIYQNEDVEQDRANLRLILEAINALSGLLSHIDALEARVEEAETIAGIATIPDVAGMAERLEAAERALAEAVKERDALRSASTIIRQRDEAVEVLGVARIALLYARDTFSHYELQHLDKQTPEGNAKADANARHANHMSQALATISKITGEEGAGAFLTKRGEK